MTRLLLCALLLLALPVHAQKGMDELLKQFREHGRGRLEASVATDALDQELFRHQLETRTTPSSSGWRTEVRPTG